MATAADWRAKALDRIRTLIREADPEAVETVKRRKPSNPDGVPAWEHAGLICTGETYKDKVKLTFAHGAKLADRAGLLDPGNGQTRAALDLREGDELNAEAFKALVRAEARSQETAQGFLNEAAALATELPGADQVTVFPAVPMTIQRVANVERAQMLLESPTRVALQRFLAAWQPVLLDVRQGPAGKGLIRWAIDVDPLNL